VSLSSISNLSCMLYLSMFEVVSCPSRGAPAWLYICNRAKVYKCPSRIRIRVAFLCLQVNLRVLVLVHLHNGPDLVY
jgi:hypothetical protein